MGGEWEEDTRDCKMVSVGWGSRNPREGKEKGVHKGILRTCELSPISSQVPEGRA